MSTHNLCFVSKERKIVYPCKLMFYYIRDGFKGVYLSRTDVILDVSEMNLMLFDSSINLHTTHTMISLKLTKKIKTEGRLMLMQFPYID